MTKIISLLKKATADDTTKDQIVEMLKSTLAEAESGQISGIFMIVEQPDEMWIERWDGRVKLSEMLGRVEIVKHKIIHQYFQSEGEV